MNGEKCPKCKEGKIFSIDRGSYIEKACDKCDYQYIQEKTSRRKQQSKPRPEQRQQPSGNFITLFQNYFRLLNKFSGILVIVLLILLLVVFTISDGQIKQTDMRVNIVDEKFQSKVDNIKGMIGTIEGNITGVKSNLNTINSKLSTAQGEIDSLEILCGTIANVEYNVGCISDNITTIKEKINSLWFKVFGDSEQTNTNVTFIYFANQTGDQRYCHVNFSVEKNETDIEEIKFLMQYDNVNISLLNQTGNYLIQENQWINGNYTDNYFLNWFGNNNKFTASYNITWNISDYNTSKILTANLKYSLMINSVLVKFPEIWEEEVA